jgi:hypothetical protein
LNKKLVLASFVILAFGSVSMVAQGPGAQTGQEKVEQARSGQAKAGGRVGKFHFVTNEQLAEDSKSRTQIRAELAGLKQDVAKLAKNDKAKQRLLTEIASFEKFVDVTEAREKEPAGPTAKRVEAILNDKKGVSQCSACHDEDDSHQRSMRGGKEGSSHEGRR